MSDEFIHTGHRVFFGKNRVENEVIKKQVPDEASSSDQAQEAAKQASTPEDIAARIANDRQQNHADILEKARSGK